MDHIGKFWNKFKQEPDIWFFYGFLLTFTFSIRKVVNYFPIQGTKERTFNEYSAIFVYISDIFLFFTILSWIIYTLSNKSSLLSNCKLWITSHLHRLYKKISLENRFLFYNPFRHGSKSTSIENSLNIPHLPCETKMFHVELLGILQGAIYIIIPLLLVVWSFISIIWSQNQNIAMFRSIKLFEYYLLYLYIVFRIVPHGTIKYLTRWKNIALIIIIIGLFQSLIGIIQFIIQHSIGLFWLKESLISPDIAGVAKFFANGQKYIRAYGLFPHPNILAGFLLFSIIITLLYKRLFCVELRTHFLIKKQGQDKVLSVPHGTILNILIFIQSLSLLLTFSKSAIVGLAIALFYIYVPRRTFMTNLKHRRNSRIVLLMSLIIILIIYLSWPILNSILYNSIQQRMLYLDVSRGTIISNPILGVGIGQFVINMSRYVNNLELWQFQPVHNVFLLIWSELGIVGLVLFIYWLYKMSRACPVDSYCSTWNNKNLYGVEQSKILRNKTNSGGLASFDKSILQNNLYSLSSDIALRYIKGILLGFIFIILFDHYFWDIQQGSVLLWMILGFIAGINKKEYNFI